MNYNLALAIIDGILADCEEVGSHPINIMDSLREGLSKTHLTPASSRIIDNGLKLLIADLMDTIVEAAVGYMKYADSTPVRSNQAGLTRYFMRFNLSFEAAELCALYHLRRAYGATTVVPLSIVTRLEIELAIQTENKLYDCREVRLTIKRVFAETKSRAHTYKAVREITGETSLVTLHAVVERVLNE